MNNSLIENKKVFFLPGIKITIKLSTKKTSPWAYQIFSRFSIKRTWVSLVPFWLFFLCHEQDFDFCQILFRIIKSFLMIRKLPLSVQKLFRWSKTYWKKACQTMISAEICLKNEMCHLKWKKAIFNSPDLF